MTIVTPSLPTPRFNDGSGAIQVMAPGASTLVWVDAGAWLVVDGGELTMQSASTPYGGVVSAAPQRVRDGGALRIAAQGWLKLTGAGTERVSWHVASPAPVATAQGPVLVDALLAAVRAFAKVWTSRAVRPEPELTRSGH